MESGKNGSRPSFLVGGNWNTDVGTTTTFVEAVFATGGLSVGDTCRSGPACATVTAPTRTKESIAARSENKMTNRFIGNQDAPALTRATISILKESFSRSLDVKPELGWMSRF